MKSYTRNLSVCTKVWQGSMETICDKGKSVNFQCVRFSTLVFVTLFYIFVTNKTLLLIQKVHEADMPRGICVLELKTSCHFLSQQIMY